MFLKSLNLIDFRNHRDLKFEFPEDAKKIIFLGDNARGKTNILEAIYLLNLTGSFRASDYTDLIFWGGDYARITAIFDKEHFEYKAEVFLSRIPKKQKIFKINKKQIALKNAIENFPMVMFCPEDMHLTYLSPAFRRRFLNRLISKIDALYIQNLIEYQKVLKHRNKLLLEIHENSARVSELEFWDQKLALHGSYLMRKRKETIIRLNPDLENNFFKIADSNQKASLTYLNAGKHEFETPEKYLAELKNNLKKDLKAKKTIYGPHRDDFTLLLDEKKMEDCASRGEYRSLILALKQAEINLIREVKKVKPLLILDDVFSELDEKRQQHLLESISGYQSFISTTHQSPLYSAEDCKVIEIKGSR